MTEAEWLACDDLEAMLGMLKVRASDRKARMFAVGSCRRLWHRPEDERSQRAVEAVEAFADGLISEERLVHARQEAFDALDVDYEGNGGRMQLAWVSANMTLVRGLSKAAEVMLSDLRHFPSCSAPDILREVVGNPFRLASFTRACLTPLARSLALDAYDERLLPSGHLGLDRFAILSDALEEAGCTDDAVLSHLRGPGPHVRGCWALDLILGKS